MRNALAAVALVFMTAASAAGQDAALRLTLEEAQLRAGEASHRLAEMRAREAAAQALVTSRRAAEQPLVTAQAGYTRTNHVDEFVVPGPAGVPRVLYPDVPDNYRTRLDLQWPIFTGGRTSALARAARAEASAVADDRAAVRTDVRLDTARAFWALVTGRATVATLEQGVGRAAAHVADVRQRFDAGLVPPNEIAAAEAQHARARMLLIEAQNQRDVAAAELARLVGVPPSTAIEPVATLEDGLRDETDQQANRAERRALERRIDAAEAQQAAAAAGRLPAMAVAGGVDYARPNPRIFPRAGRWQESWDAGINVTWPLWDGGRVAADVAHAASLATAARHRLAEFDAIVSVEVRQRTLEIASGRAAVAAAEEAIRAAAEARRVAAERYRAGVLTQIEVLDAEFVLLQAELDRTRALAGIRLAEARLARALGR